MDKKTDLTHKDAHFAFGKNWASYAEQVSKIEINQAAESLRRLLGGNLLNGKRVLDIGCGSGIHSLSSLQLGAREVIAVDIDPQSVYTAETLLQHHAAGCHFRVIEKSIFDIYPDDFGLFDLVYSWGVLHHTGDMDRAIRRATQMVSTDGEFAFALYHQTLMCPVWKVVKKWYSNASQTGQSAMRLIYNALKIVRLWARGRSYRSFLQDYHQQRGMNYYTDVHDWLGGYPYESILPGHVERLMVAMGFSRVRWFVRDWIAADLGLFGTGCDEYVYRKASRI